MYIVFLCGCVYLHKPVDIYSRQKDWILISSVSCTLCVCVCVYIYIYIYIYTHTHTHTTIYIFFYLAQKYEILSHSKCTLSLSLIYIYIYIHTHTHSHWGAFGVMFSIVENEHGFLSSNPEGSCSAFLIVLIPLGKGMNPIILPPVTSK